jgi:hypothetical protein
MINQSERLFLWDARLQMSLKQTKDGDADTTWNEKKEEIDWGKYSYFSFQLSSYLII